MQLERKECAENDNTPWVALMGLHELLVTCVFSQDHQEEKAEDEVAKNFYNQSESCSIEDKRNNIVGRLRESSLQLKKVPFKGRGVCAI